MNEEQHLFYSCEHARTNLGFAQIVKKAMRTSAPAYELDPAEIGFHLDVCSICVELTRSQLRNVGNMVEKVALYYSDINASTDPSISTLINKVQSNLQKAGINQLTEAQLEVLRQTHGAISQANKKEKELNRKIFKWTKPAKTFADLDNFYLKAKTSIFQNLPVPDVLMTSDGYHSYVPLPQIVAGFLGSGVHDLEVPSAAELNSDAMASYYTSPRAMEVYQESNRIAIIKGLEGQCFSLHIKDWADDAQKTARASVFSSYNIRTCTFMKHRMNGDIRYYSYPISLGVKGMDHLEVEKQLNKELEYLQEPNYFYSGYHKKAFYCTVSLVAGIRDRPARGETFLIGNHNHVFAKRFGYAAFHSESQKVMPCMICNIARIHRLRKKIYVPKSTEETYCEECADLDYNSPLMKFNVNQLKKKQPTDPTKKKKAETFRYPTICLTGSPPPPAARPINGTEDVIIAPVKLTFSFLTDVLLVAFFNYHNMIHMQYIRSMATQTARRTMQRATGWTLMNLRSYLRISGLTEELCENIKEFSEENMSSPPQDMIDKFKANVIPVTWTRLGCEVHHQLDAVFHLLYHGVAMDVWEIFLNAISPIKIAGNAGLRSGFKDLLKVLESIHNLHLYDLPINAFTKGKTTLESYAGWAGVNKMAFSFLMPYIASHCRYLYKTLAARARRQLPSNQERIIQRVQLAIHSFTCASTLIVQRSISQKECQLMGEYFKLFISEITAVEETYEEDKKNLSYLTTGNFLSLLNLEENTALVGPLRNFWDANDEKNVQDIKRYWPHVNQSSPNWQKALLQGVIREKFLRLLWNRKNPTQTQSNSFENTGPKNTYIHLHKTILQDNYGFSAQPFAAVYQVPTSNFFVLLRDAPRSSAISKRKIHVSTEYKTLGSCEYYMYKFGDSDFFCDIQELTKTFHDDYIPVLFLPFQWHQKDEKKEQRQTMATILSLDRHMVYHSGAGFVLPSFSLGTVEKNDDLAFDIDADNVEPKLAEMVAI